MKYKPKQYATALAEVMQKGELSDKEVANFLRLLEKNQDLKKAKEIVSQAENIFAKKAGKHKVLIEVARKQKGDLPALLRKALQAGLVYKKIKPELIAGIRVVVDGEKQLDYSMARKLQELF